MRTIKFRGFSQKKGEWVYGSLHVFEALRQPSSPKTYIRSGQQNRDWIKVAPSSVGESVGLSDINEGEIYEGDYISIVYKYDGLSANLGVIPDQDCFCEGVVVYMSEVASWGIRLYKAEYPIKEDLERCEFLIVPLSEFDLEPDSIEVKGNAYANPELLKGGEE